MVKGLFCHYLPIYKDKDGVYCSTTLTNDLFSRYFCVVDELYVATRVYPIKTTYIEAHQEMISLDGVKIVEFPNLSSINGLLKELHNAKKKVASIVGEVDLIFIRGGIIALLGVDAARRQGKPYLMECSGCAWDEYWHYSLTGKIIAPYMEYRARRDTKYASYVIYVTEKWLQARYPTNGVSTYASNVMISSIDDTALDRRIEKIAGFKKKPIKIGTTGGIGNKAKGQQYVIKAMKKLINNYDIVYELVGGGDDTYLRKLANKYGLENRVFFHGQLTHEEVLDWLDGIDVYIQPSMQEGLPRALIEAMSRACPSIGSSTAGIPELLPESSIFKRGSVKELTQVMRNTFEGDLATEAQRNFAKSKDFYIEYLNDRRTQIYKMYSNYVGK